MNSEETADILALALAFYRTPLHYPELRRGQGELPEGMTLLLRVAGEGIRSTGLDERLRGASAEKVRQAALFFIEQVCLSPQANHYRVLGLEVGAGERQIKEHHRLLMRLFHPDRQGVREDWTDTYAARINQAYHVLRRPALRGAYDASLHEPKSPPRGRGEPSLPLRTLTGLSVEPTAPVFRLPRPLVRRLPQLVLTVVAVLLALGIYLLHGRAVLNTGSFLP